MEKTASELYDKFRKAIKDLEEALEVLEECWAVATRSDGCYSGDTRLLAIDNDGFVWMTSPIGGCTKAIKFMSKEEAVTVARVLGHRAVRVDENFTIVEEADV